MVLFKKKAKRPTTNDLVSNINFGLSHLLPQWQALKSQHDLYYGHPDFKNFNSWFDGSNRLKRRLRKIGDALLALDELQLSNLPLQQKKIIHQRLLSIISLNVAKLEIIQAKKLYLDDPLRSGNERAVTKAQYRSQLKKLEDQLNEEKWSRQFDNYETRFIQRTFKKHEIHTIHFKNYTDPAQKAGMFAGLVAISYSFVKKVELAFPAAFAIEEAIKNGLMTIPIVDAVFTAIPLIINFLKTVIKRQSPNKKIQAGLLVGFILGGIAAAIFFPPLAAAVGVASVALGLMRGHLIPFGKIQTKITEKKIELNLMEARVHDFLNKSKKTFPLEPHEKMFLMRKLESYLSSKLNQADFPSIKEINLTKSIIQGGDFDNLAKDPLSKKVLQKDLKEELLNYSIERRVAINDELAALQKQRALQSKLLVTGIMSFIGIILVCIPTPPTLILGASLLLASSVAAPIIKFDLITKAKNFIVSLFTKNPETGEYDHQIKSRAERTHESTAAIIKKVPNSAPANKKEKSPVKSDFGLKSRKERFLFSEERKIEREDEKPLLQGPEKKNNHH